LLVGSSYCLDLHCRVGCLPCVSDLLPISLPHTKGTRRLHGYLARKTNEGETSVASGSFYDHSAICSSLSVVASLPLYISILTGTRQHLRWHSQNCPEQDRRCEAQHRLDHHLQDRIRIL